MRILALEPYYGGSHKAFLDGWSPRSRHVWTVLGLPAYKWKWRMRHAAVTFADQVCALVACGESWDAIFCSDMLNLAEFLGLLSPETRSKLGDTTVAYFHENQLTYPVRHESERDYQFGLTNITTALAADRVWFNTAFHRDSFLTAAVEFLKRMPDHQPVAAVEAIRANSQVHPPGITEPPSRGPRRPGPIRILWAARWEQDKNPDAFFGALGRLKLRGVDFRISVIGEQFRDAPAVFDRARGQFKDHIDRWGHQPTRRDYESALTEADVIVSTADHEFFGISVVEAIAAGAYPLLPKRLSYPEVLSEADNAEDFFYEGDADELAEKLALLAERLARGDLWMQDPRRGIRAVARFSWSRLVPLLDDAIAL